jgi:hypothetical protein
MACRPASILLSQPARCPSITVAYHCLPPVLARIWHGAAAEPSAGPGTEVDGS